MQDVELAVNEFISEVFDIDETDYGDFMRKANHSLIQLKDKIYDESGTAVKNKIYELKYIIDYVPNWNVESTKEKILALASEICQLAPSEAPRKQEDRSGADFSLSK